MKSLKEASFFLRKTAGLPKRLGDDPALGFADIFRTGITANRGAPHETLMLRRVEPGGSVDQSSVVVDYEIALVPIVCIDEFGPRIMRHQLIK